MVKCTLLLFSDDSMQQLLLLLLFSIARRSGVCDVDVQGVVGAATGAGVIIGTYFAFYSTTKRFLRSNTQLNEGGIGSYDGGNTVKIQAI